MVRKQVHAYFKGDYVICIQKKKRTHEITSEALHNSASETNPRTSCVVRSRMPQASQNVLTLARKTLGDWLHMWKFVHAVQSPLPHRTARSETPIVLARN